MNELRKKAWQRPILDVMDVHKTMEGSGIRYSDTVHPDPDASDHDVLKLVLKPCSHIPAL